MLQQQETAAGIQYAVEIVVRRFVGIKRTGCEKILSWLISVEERYNPLLKKDEICCTESCTSSTRREDS